MRLPTNDDGTFDYDNAFEACDHCEAIFWAFDIGRSGLCESCETKSRNA